MKQPSAVNISLARKHLKTKRTLLNHSYLISFKTIGPNQSKRFQILGKLLGKKAQLEPCFSQNQSVAFNSLNTTLK